MFFVSAAFAFQPAPPEGRVYDDLSYPAWVWQAEQPKVADPPAVIGFALDPTGELVGRVIYTGAVPMPLDELLRAYAGVHTGPDGQPWMAGGALTVAIDGVSLGDGARSPLLDRRSNPGSVPVGVQTPVAVR